MWCKAGVCWFKINIILCVVTVLSCLSCNLFYDGPPHLIDAGMRLIYITTILSTLISFICIASLSSDSRSTCVIVFCDVGLILSFLVSFYCLYTLESVQLDPGQMKEYTQNHFKGTGNPPPFLDSIQQRMKCCGIYGGKDYTHIILTHNVSSSFSVLVIPPTCCVVKDYQIPDEVKGQKLRIQPVENKTHLGVNKSLSEEEESRIKIKFFDRVKNYLADKDKVQSSRVGASNLTLPNEENDMDGTSQLLHPQGCQKYAETIQAFLANVSNKETTKDWLTFPLEMKEFFLRFITVSNLVLIFVFSYYLSRNRFRRRPTVIPRAPPPPVEDHPGDHVNVRPFPFIYENPGSPASPPLMSDGRLDISVNLQRPPPEFGLHPFMLSAMMQHQSSRDNNEQRQGSNINSGPNSDVVSAQSINNNNNLDLTPSAPPPPYNSLKHIFKPTA